MFEISAYVLNPIFTKNVNNLENSTTDSSLVLAYKPQSSLVLYLKMQR